MAVPVDHAPMPAADLCPIPHLLAERVVLVALQDRFLVFNAPLFRIPNKPDAFPVSLAVAPRHLHAVRRLPIRSLAPLRMRLHSAEHMICRLSLVVNISLHTAHSTNRARHPRFSARIVRRSSRFLIAEHLSEHVRWLPRFLTNVLEHPLAAHGASCGLNFIAASYLRAFALASFPSPEYSPRVIVPPCRASK